MSQATAYNTAGSGEQKPSVADLLQSIFEALSNYYGPQNWWPSATGSPWEIMVGAVLTQRTSWTNVELSLANMIAAWGSQSLTNPGGVLEASDEELGKVLRPTGFYTSKPRTLKGLARYVMGKGGLEQLARSAESTESIRSELLGLWGIGAETADAVLLYALRRPAFIADAYALRLASRWGLIRPTARYEETRALFTDNLPGEARLFNEYHALIVTHAKQICRARPLCNICPLNSPLRASGIEGTAADWLCPKTGVTSVRR
jgi:endonuclease-3 related protein